MRDLYVIDVVNKKREDLVTNNYDLNIWDELGHETSGEELGGWVITPHQMCYDATGELSTGGFSPELKIVLTPTEAKELTLGWGEDLGGDYTEDEDFFIDSHSFFDTYKNIPARVRSLVMALPEYEMDRWVMIQRSELDKRMNL